MRTLLLAVLLAGCPRPADTVDDTSAAGRFACGDTTCAEGDACVIDQLPPACENRTDTGAPCPDGTTATQCGGAGIPCCCEPAPAPTYRCAGPGTCAGELACDCLGEVCADDYECSATASTAGPTFTCSELPKP